MLIGGIDPGNAAPGYAYLKDGALHYAGVLPFTLRVDAVAVEGQWVAARGSGRRIGAKAMASLAFDAGLRLGLVDAAVRYRLPPNVWRDALWPNGGALPKSVVVARLRRDLAAAGYHVDGTDDVVEACGIAFALARLMADPPKALRKYEVRR